MNDCRQHQFQVLTKRAERLAEVAHELTWTKNVWMGVSVENQKVEHRIQYLKQTPAIIKFLSLEPLIGPLPNLDLSGIDWVIVGGESGRKPRPIKSEWVLDIKNQCEMADIAFFFKQWGGTNKKKSGRLLEGKTYDDMPKLSQPAFL
jgi:protein gp37